MKLDRSKAVVSVDAHLVAKCLPFAAMQDVRYYLNGVHLQPAAQGGVLITATDGHALYCVRDPAGVADRPLILPLAQRKHARFMRADHRLLVDAEGLTWVEDRVKSPIWVSPDRPIDGKFPDCSLLIGVLDEWLPGLQGSFNPALLERAIGADGKNEIRFFHKPTSKTILFTAGRDAFGLVMPLRGDVTPLAQIIPPEFLPATPEATHAS